MGYLQSFPAICCLTSVKVNTQSILRTLSAVSALAVFPLASAWRFPDRLAAARGMRDSFSRLGQKLFPMENYCSLEPCCPLTPALSFPDHFPTLLFLYSISLIQSSLNQCTRLLRTSDVAEGMEMRYRHIKTFLFLKEEIHFCAGFKTVS